MIRGIDHLVIAVADADRAADELEAATGLRCTGGGRHERFGTRNRLAFLADGSYVELIGIEDVGLAGHNPVGAATHRALERGGGLATLALCDDDLATTVAARRAAGIELGPILDGHRVRDDGEVVAWRTAFGDDDLVPDGVPFLIEHRYAGVEWGPEAMAARAAYRHPIGSPVELTAVDVASDDPRAAGERLAATLGLDVHAVVDLAVAPIGPHVLRFRPAREMPIGATVTLRAAVDAPRIADAAGTRWQIVPAVDGGTGTDRRWLREPAEDPAAAG
jgi:hypothetical protein